MNTRTRPAARSTRSRTGPAGRGRRPEDRTARSGYGRSRRSGPSSPRPENTRPGDPPRGPPRSTPPESAPASRSGRRPGPGRAGHPPPPKPTRHPQPLLTRHAADWPASFGIAPPPPVLPAALPAPAGALERGHRRQMPTPTTAPAPGRTSTRHDRSPARLALAQNRPTRSISRSSQRSTRPAAAPLRSTARTWTPREQSTATTAPRPAVRVFSHSAPYPPRRGRPARNRRRSRIASPASPPGAHANPARRSPRSSVQPGAHAEIQKCDQIQRIFDPADLAGPRRT